MQKKYTAVISSFFVMGLLSAAPARASDAARPGSLNYVEGQVSIGKQNLDAKSIGSVELQPGDCLICYTDALIESNDADGEMLGEAGLLKIVRLLTAPDGEALDNPQRTAERLLEEIEARCEGNLTDDDVTVLVVKANGRAPHYSTRDKVRAMGRFAKSLIRGLIPGGERPPLPDWNLANLGGAIIPALARRWRVKS